MKKFLLRLLFSKKQRQIIWKALLYSEYVYRKRGNVDYAAVVQTVINETEKSFNCVKSNYTKEEVDYIVSNVIKETKMESEKLLKEAYKKGVDSCREQLNSCYQKGYDDAMNNVPGVILIKKNDENDSEEKEESHQEENDFNQENNQEEKPKS